MFALDLITYLRSTMEASKICDINKFQDATFITWLHS